MTKQLLSYENSNQKPIVLNPEIISGIDLNQVIYGERTQSGGMGNGVFIKKGVKLEIKEYTKEEDRWDSHLVLNSEGRSYMISSSVYGVFRNVARQLRLLYLANE